MEGFVSILDANTPIRWDIVEEHLDEAAFLYGQWEDALRSPLYTLAEIADGPEGRMLAHIDGLVIGGPRVAKKLLLPALAADEPGLVFAAAFALVDGDRPEDFEAVIDALKKGEPAQRAAIRRALAVVPRLDVGQRLAALAVKAATTLQADLLEVLGYLRVDPGLRLEPLLTENEALGIRLARAFPSKLDPRGVERGFSSPDPVARAAAFETALIIGQRGAFAACENEVSAHGPSFGRAAVLVGLSGDQNSANKLAEALGDAKHAREAAFGLGFSGRLSAADALLELMTNDKLASVAVEGFAAITGLRVEKEFAREAKRWSPDGQDLEEEEEYGPEGDLPKPEPETITRWWKKARPKFDPARRWLGGQPWNADALLRELEIGAARRREPLTLELGARTYGQVQIAWNVLSVRQLKEIGEARRQSVAISARPFREAMPYPVAVGADPMASVAAREVRKGT
jgi:uncharacterized protein (TIGR02270 family)